MNLRSLIKTRRSVYPVDYIDRPIPREALVELLECANAAPTHKLTQPWRYIVYHKSGLQRLRKQLQHSYRAYTNPHTFKEKKFKSIEEKILRSGAVIIICVHLSGKVPEEEELAAVACSVQNLWLAAHEMGIGGYWSTPEYVTQMTEAFGLEENERCIGLFYLGYHKNNEEKALKRMPIAEKVKWVTE